MRVMPSVDMLVPDMKSLKIEGEVSVATAASLFMDGSSTFRSFCKFKYQLLTSLLFLPDNNRLVRVKSFPGYEEFSILKFDITHKINSSRRAFEACTATDYALPKAF